MLRAAPGLHPALLELLSTGDTKGLPLPGGGPVKRGGERKGGAHSALPKEVSQAPQRGLVGQILCGS